MKTKNLILYLVLLIGSLLLAACQKGNAPVSSGAASATNHEPIDSSDDIHQPSLRISEAMPSNKDYIFDEDGDSSDWLELVNLGDKPVSLNDYWLSLKDSSVAWHLPEIVLNKGERFLIFCSEKNRERHSSFTLPKSGETIILTSSSGQSVDEVFYPPMESNSSICFISDQEQPLEEGVITFQPSPGFPNSDSGYESFLSQVEHAGELVINEAVFYNQSFPERPGQYYDWVELKNNSDHTVSLHDYYISDQIDQLQKTQLPEIVLEPGELFLVYCSGNQELSSGNFFHTCFALKPDDQIYLSDARGNLSDKLFLHGLPLYGSIGRLDGQSGPWYFETPSPNKPNQNGFRSLSGSPHSSVEQGVYHISEPLSVELIGEGNIFYTLNGSVPDQSDYQYDGPILVSKSTVIRAVCQEDHKLVSPISTFSYIINEEDTLPVTSLICDPNEMFGASGVYNASRGLNVKKDASVAFFDNNGGGFAADCSVELHGAHSRTAFKKKSFELKFSSRYGGDVKYDLFGDGIRTRFSTLLLRGGSSSNLDTVKDCFASKLMLEYSPWLYPQNLRYTSVYINGQYFGIYAWREGYSEQYFSDHTGMPEEGISMVRGPVSGGSLLDLLNYGSTHSLSSEKEFNRFADQFDLNSLAGWMAIQSYYNNLDINGNIRYVKLSETSKWQLITYDLDYSCLTSTTGWDTVLASYQLGPVCKSLLQNNSFRELLLKNCAEFYSNGFTTERILSLYEEMLLPLDDDSVKKDCFRWGDDFDKWAKYKNAMREHLGDPRMVDWLAGLKSLTKASNEQMHSFFPEYY